MVTEKYNLIVVDSDVKASTIMKHLQDEPEDWIVESTGGQLFDLPKQQYGLHYDEDGVIADWQFISQKARERAENIKHLVNGAEVVFIGTNDDRDGERIARDIIAFLGVGEKNKEVKISIERVVFKEITKKAITEELYQSIREVNDYAVQAARMSRFIDREIGFPISFLLRKTLGAEVEKKSDGKMTTAGVGRILSPALHLLCETEKMISNFISETYLQVNITYVNYGRSFKVYNEQKFREDDQITLNHFINQLQESYHKVTAFMEKIRNVSPPKPLHTSSLLRSSFYLLNINPNEGMKIAQKLFDNGLITYYNTDSFFIEPSAVKKIRKHILSTYSKDYLSSKPRDYSKTKKNKIKKLAEDKEEESDEVEIKGEAIRPTKFDEKHTPWYLNEDSSEYSDLNKNDLLVYALIWARTIASQMADATYDGSTIEITVAEETFSARANSVIFKGWEKISDDIIPIKEESRIESQWKRKIVRLPKIKDGTVIIPLDIDVSSHFTRAPQRYGIGRFIDTLYTQGLGTAATVSGFIERLISKGYIAYADNGKTLKPTDLGMLVDSWVSEYFPWLNNIEHAKMLMQKLSAIEAGKDGISDELIIEYHELVRSGADMLGIDLDVIFENKPSKSQIKKIIEISKKLNINVGSSIFEDKEKASLFIRKYTDVEDVGQCPYCKNGKILIAPNYFKCNNNECNFMITNKRIIDFFKRFKVNVDEFSLRDIAQRLLSSSGYLRNDLVSSNGKNFKSRLVFKYDKEYGWNVGFKNENIKKKEVKNENQ